jgi:hypothetical protein
LKKQTGFWVDAEVWDGYKRICKLEELRPYAPVEGFLRVVLSCGSALVVLAILRDMVASRVECFEDYCRVLLSWFRQGRFFVPMAGGQVHLETLLLLALKEVVDSKLRGEIREALMMKHVEEKDGEKSGLDDELDEEEEVAPKLGAPHIAERLERIGEEVRGRELSTETVDKALKKLLEIQEKLKRERASLG